MGRHAPQEIYLFLPVFLTVSPLMSLNLLPSVHVSSQIPNFKVETVGDVVVFLVVLT